MKGASPRQRDRRRWLALVIGVMVLHTIVVRWLLAGNDVAVAIATDLELAPISMWAACACLVTARRCTERHARIAWGAIAVGVALWSIAGVTWSFRELVLGEIAPAPSLLDAPFFSLAPSFAIALVFYNRQHPSHALQLRQFADIGILTATIVLLGTLVLAGPLEASQGDPYVYVAVGYPAFYLAVILAGFTMLAGHDWGPRRVIISLLICAHFMFAIVDLLYGAKVLEAQYQTEMEDTLWLGGFLLIIWAAREERLLVGVHPVERREPASPDAVVGAIVIAAIGALGAKTVVGLEGAHWMLVAAATLFLAACVAVRVWVGGRLEDAYADAVAEGESKTRALTVERDRSARLRGAGSLARGTAHEVNNMLQAIAGNFALLRRRATRSEDITPYLTAIEQVLERLNNEVAGLRRVAAEGGPLQVIALLPGGDPDGRLAPILADAGYAPAKIPSVPDALLALKSGTLHAIVASRDEAKALDVARVALPVIVRDGDDLLQVVISIVGIS